MSLAKSFGRCSRRALSIQSCTQLDQGEVVRVVFSDGAETDFSSLWLRDNCLQFATASHRKYAIPGEHDQVSEAKATGGQLSVAWQDQHRSIFPADYLRRYRQEYVSDMQNSLKPQRLGPNNPVPTVNYEDLSDEYGLYLALKHANDFGCVIVKGAPPTKEGAEDLMAKFCEVPAYIPLYGYGSDFLLGTEKNETQKACPQCFCNIPKPIEMHQDFAYFEDVPGLFFNLCMRIDEGVQGGQNTAMDVFLVAEDLRENDPESFKTLCETTVTFAKTALNSQRPVKTSVDRPIIKLDPNGEILDVIWSLMYLRTQRLDPVTLEKFSRAREAFVATVHKLSAAGYEVPTPMGPGDCTIMNNRRVMHGRLPFVSLQGVRQFYQSYGAQGLFNNRYKVLQSKFEDNWHVHRGGSALSVATQ